MAKIVEGAVAVRLSKLVKDNDNSPIFVDSKLEILKAALVEICESVIDDTGVVVEVEILE